MKSKTSYFNKAVFKKDITLLWSLWAVEIFIVLLTLIYPLMSEINSIKHDYSDKAGIISEIRQLIVAMASILTNPIIILVLAIVVAVVIFQYMFNARDMYMIHSLPIKREALFISHYVSGVVIMLIPYVIGYFSLFLADLINSTQIETGLFLCMFETFTMILLFYSIACAVVMVCGNSIMSIVIYCVSNVLYVVCSVIFYVISDFFSYAENNVSIAQICRGGLNWLSPVIYLSVNKTGFVPTSIGNMSSYVYVGQNSYEKCEITFNDVLPFFGILAAAVTLSAIVLLLYKYRKSETVGDVVSFGWCKPVYRTVFSIVSGILLTFVIWVIGFDNDVDEIEMSTDIGTQLIFMAIAVICVAICYFISEMTLRKTFFVWKKFNKYNFVAVIGFIIIYLMTARSGAFGVRVPDAKDVAAIELSSNQNLLFADRKQIDELVKIHDKIEEEKKQPDIEDNVSYVTIGYTLNDGTELNFQYKLLTDEKSPFKEFWDEQVKNDKVNEALFSRAYKDSDFKVFEICINDCENGDFNYEEKDYDMLYSALLEDIKEGNIDFDIVNKINEENIGTFDIDFSVSKKLAEKYKFTNVEAKHFSQIYFGESSSYADIYVSVEFGKKAKNVLAAIEKIKNNEEQQQTVTNSNKQ